MQVENERPSHWTDHFVIGRMPLFTAWVYALVGGVSLTYVIATVASESSAEGYLAAVWVSVPALLMPMVAASKRRRKVIWGLLAVGLFFVGTPQPFIQPIAGLLAVLFAAKSPIRIPEAQLEADESPSGFRSLVHVARDVAAVQTAMAEDYVRRDTARLAGRYADVQRIESRLDQVTQQRSARGQRARLHMTASTRMLLRSAEAADEIEELLRADLGLSDVIHGHQQPRGKSAKRAVKVLSQVEDMIGRSSNQLLVASAILEDLGYPVRREDGDEPDAASESPAVQDAEATKQPQGKPRPQRSHRRRRF